MRVSSLSTPEHVLVGFFLFHPVSVKDFSLQPRRAMVLKVHVSVIRTYWVGHNKLQVIFLNAFQGLILRGMVLNEEM